MEQLVGRSRAASFTYPAVGATTSGALPVGYRHVRRHAVLGHGEAAFHDAAAALLGWQMHRRAGVRVHATAAVAAPETVVVLAVGVGPLQVLAPCRVVYRVDEPRRVGFAYGTLPGHPESGEEAFVIEHVQDDDVVLHITAFSRPATWYARLGGPAARAAQDLITRRYVSALRTSSLRGPG
jgi:uncharacterized protein (UPF0548 family)